MSLNKSYRPDSRHKLDKNSLIKATSEIKRHFSHFLSKLQQYLLDLERGGGLDISVVKTQIAIYDRQLKVPLSYCKSLQEAFDILSSSDNSSFLDYELIKVLTDYGNEELKLEFIDYKKRLQMYFKCRLIACSTPQGEKIYAVLVDESLTDEITDKVRFLNRVKNILGLKDLTVMHWDNLPLDWTASTTEESFVSPEKKESCDPEIETPKMPTSQESIELAITIGDRESTVSVKASLATSIHKSPSLSSISGCMANDNDSLYDDLLLQCENTSSQVRI